MKNAYSTPLIVSRVSVTGLPSRVIVLSAVPPNVAGSIARRPVAPAPTPILNERRLLLHEIASNVEPLRPSSHVSIWRLVTTGTPRAFADATIAFAPGEFTTSVCMFALNAP